MELLSQSELATRFAELHRKKFPVLDDGHVMLVDMMGSDQAICEAARVSYGAGIEKRSEDVTLIRYLLRHRHTTPFEMVEFKFRVRVPMDAWRQWIRHRTACLAGNTVISFDLPGGKSSTGLPRHYPLTVAEIYERFQPTRNAARPDKQKDAYYKRGRARAMLLRSYDEETDQIYYTHVRDIWQTGIKPIIRVEFPDNKILRASADHLCLTDSGWLKLEEALDSRAMFLSAERSRVDESQWQVPTIIESEEVWRSVVGYESRYEVSNMGRVRAWYSAGGRSNVMIRIVPRLKGPTIDNRGYLVVSLSKRGGTTVHPVHRLVLEAFVGRRAEGQEARHTNHNRLDNRLSNLSWGTLQENVADRMRSGCTQRLAPTFLTPVSWRRDGEEMTYDLSVDGPCHNFFAGGVVVHNSVNEYSTRYSEAISDRQKTAPDRWRSQSHTNKQGSAESLTAENLDPLGKAWLTAEEAGAKAAGSIARSPGEHLTEQEQRLHDHAYEVYRERLGFGVAREQARKDLPLSTYTEAYWKMDLHNLLHFLGLRMDSHAQQEIRSYAWVIGEQIVAKLVPVTWQAFLDYHFNSVRLTRLDCEMIGKICTACAGSESDYLIPITIGEFLDLQHEDWVDLKRCRERDECLEKLRHLGIVV